MIKKSKAFIDHSQLIDDRHMKIYIIQQRQENC